MRTEVPFTLPMGYVDGNGNVHREGRMRLATARDEIEPLGDAEVRQQPGVSERLARRADGDADRRDHRDHARAGRGSLRR